MSIQLGTILGYCSMCLVAVGEKELGKECTSCGQVLKKDELLSIRELHVHTQTLKESAMARYYPGYNRKENFKHDA